MSGINGRVPLEIEALVTPALMKVSGEPVQKEMERKGLQLADFAGDDKVSVLAVLAQITTERFYQARSSIRLSRKTDREPWWH